MTDDIQRTPLSRLLADIVASDTGHAAIEIPDDWLQGRAIYGGLSAALCLQAALVHVPHLAPLRSSQLAFIAPAGPGVSFTPEILRQGKSATFVGVDMRRDDSALAARATFCFGAARSSQLAFMDAAVPSVARPEQASAFFEDASGRHLGPNFARHFESRNAGGAGPMSGAQTPEFTAWMRHRDRDVPVVEVALAALADALPPAAMACFEGAAPVSSITWQFDLLADAPTTEDGWWLCRSRAEAIADGYAAQTMAIWNRDGHPVMVGRQSVAVFY